MDENDDEEMETELQDTLKESAAVSTSATSENATTIIKPFQKAFSVEATSTTGTVCCVLHLKFIFSNV